MPHHQMKTIMHGDYVLAQPTDNSKRGRREGRWFVFLSAQPHLLVVSSLEYGHS
ncbi:hypothetical protein O9992_10670 [Vibrio lentus]|nr:hypothetical protein [Vibrio lentus]